MSRTLLIVADDFGYGFARNRGILKCYTSQAISCASALVNCKHSLDAAELAQKYEMPVGLHFNLTEGLPISGQEKVKSLVNSEGKFLGKSNFWHNRNIEPAQTNMMSNEPAAKRKKVTPPKVIVSGGVKFIGKPTAATVSNSTKGASCSSSQMALQGNTSASSDNGNASEHFQSPAAIDPDDPDKPFRDFLANTANEANNVEPSNGSNMEDLEEFLITNPQ